MSGRFVLAIAIVAIAGAAALDVVSPATTPGPRDAPAVVEGVLGCPFAVLRGAHAGVHLANVGTTHARARITFVPQRGRASTVTRSLPPGGVASSAVRARAPASAIVEYAGGEIVASHTMALPARAGGPGAAASICARAGPASLVVAGMQTLRAESRLALVNPGTAPADVSVALLADGRMIRPERLKRRIVPPRARREFRLGDFAFDARSLAAVIRSSSGRVVAEGLLVTRRGVTIHSAQVPAARAVLPAAASGPGARALVSATGEEDAGVEATLISENRRGAGRGIPPEIAPAAAVRATIPRRDGGGPAAYSYEVGVGSPLAAQAVWEVARRSGRDLASAEAAEPASRWAAVIGGRGIIARALIVNAGQTPAHVRLRRLGRDGERTTDVLVAPGRLLARVLVRGDGPVAFEIVSDAPVVVALDARSRGRPQTMAMTATALRAPSAVDVRIDPRAGVPAPLPRST